MKTKTTSMIKIPFNQNCGVLHYSSDKKTAKINFGQDFINYYFSLIPFYERAQRQRYEAHITVVRVFESPNLDLWGKYEGEIIPFEYLPLIKFDGTYYYLDAYSNRVGDIREELGLPRFRMNDSYHITIGNIKYVNQ